MKWRWTVLFLISLLALFGCSPGAEETTTVALLPTAKAPASPSATRMPLEEPTATVPTSTPPPTAAPTDTATPLPTPSATPLPPDLSLSADDVILHPGPEIYEGDLVTFQVFANVPEGLDPDRVEVDILIDDETLVDATLGWRTLGGDVVGLYEWVWNTAELAGEHSVQVIVDPDDEIGRGDENPENNQAALEVLVRPAGERSRKEAIAEWVVQETACCRVYLIRGTAAYRDRTELLELVDSAAAQASERLGLEIREPLEIYFIDRVIGQGGYAGNSMVISYLDRNYAGGGLYEVLVHESTHLLDRQIAPHRISFLAEGVAVWVTGGHYKPEPLDERTAALVEIGEYVPLAELIDNFYPIQHEIGYLEGAGFVNYLVQNYGWERVRAFYGDVRPEDDRPLSEIVDQQLHEHFDRSLAETEAAWLEYLAGIRVEEAIVQDLETTLRYYNVMRAYQQQYDPTAYFLDAWLPFADEARDRGLTADFIRHPSSELHITLEAMLGASDDALREGQYDRAEALLDSVERVLDNDGLFLDPLGKHYLDIVQTMVEEGYEVQQIDLDGDRASVLATPQGTSRLDSMTVVLGRFGWLLVQ